MAHPTQSLCTLRARRRRRPRNTCYRAPATAYPDRSLTGRTTPAFLAHKQIHILIDKLDEHWVDVSIRFKLIRSLIESLKSFRRISNLKILVALRSDVLERGVQETR